MTDIVLIRGRGTVEADRSAALGILSLASYLENKGVKAEIIDRNRGCPGIDETIKEIKSLKPSFIGLSALTSQSADILNLARACRNTIESRLVFGGLHFSACPEEALKLGGIVIQGEGEKALLELCRKNNGNHGVIKGIPLNDIDEIPVPSSRFLNRTTWSPTEYLLMTSRGCPYDCYFCLKPDFKKGGIRFHSVDYICRYLKYLIKEYNVRTFFFMDDILTVNKERIINLCREISRRKIKASFKCFGHVNFLDEEVLGFMKDAGFYQVQIGVESGDQGLLKRLGKHIELSRVKDTVKRIKRAGLDVVTLFMIGNITETEESIKRTISFAKELGSKNWFSYAVPFPGSRFYDESHLFGRIVEEDMSRWRNETLVFIPKGLEISQMKNFMIQARQLPSEFNYSRPESRMQKGMILLKRFLKRRIFLRRLRYR
jgi:radical SAM superfamily enzyme YgiQ (UPF0313 family)